MITVESTVLIGMEFFLCFVFIRFRKEMEEKWNEKKEEHKQQVCNFKIKERFIHKLFILV